ncbi:unnamed protein product, partial [Allacma fusca]
YTTDSSGGAPAVPADYPPPQGGCGSYPSNPSPPQHPGGDYPPSFDPQGPFPVYDPSYPQPCPQGPYTPGGPAGKPFFQCPQSEQMFSLVFNFLDIIINMLMVPVPVMPGNGYDQGQPGFNDYGDMQAMAG